MALWKKENRLHGFILLDMPEIGLYHIKAHVVAVKSALKFNGSNAAYSINNHINAGDSMRPVTGVSIRHAINVRKYLLKRSRTGRISTVNVTPEHRFYVSNRQAFIPIAEVLPSDKLITDTGEEVRIVADSKGRKGRQQYHDEAGYVETLKTVYNLEVSKKHTYFAGNVRVFVHNMYKVTHHENGRTKFEGHVDSEMNGSGAFYRDDGTLKYKGGIRGNTPHGQGNAHDDLGALVYRGDFVNGKRSGYGKSFDYVKSRDGDSIGRFVLYDGYWENDKYHGEGVLYFYGYQEVNMQGRFYEGELINGEIYDLLSSDNPEDDSYSHILSYRGALKYGRYDGYGVCFGYMKNRKYFEEKKGFWIEGTLCE